MAKAPSHQLTILGIDPGLANTGYGLIRVNGAKMRLWRQGTFTSSSGLPDAQRLHLIWQQAMKLIKITKPDLTAIEDIFLFKNHKTVIKTAQAKAVIMLASQQAKIPVIELSPLQVKQNITGYGRASKMQVAAMVARFLNLPSHNTCHSTDALACALCALTLINNRQKYL